MKNSVRAYIAATNEDIFSVSPLTVYLQIVQGNPDFIPFDVFETPHDFPLLKLAQLSAVRFPGRWACWKERVRYIGVAEILAMPPL